MLSPLQAEDIPDSSKQVRDMISGRLPRVELADLLIEVDRWTGFTRHIEQASGMDPRSQDCLTGEDIGKRLLP